MHSKPFDLEMPDDFPLAELEAIHSHLSDPSEARRESPEWAEWAGACNGILYRYKASDEHAESLAGSLDQSTSPPHPERYRQEKLLFSFFVEGLSCVECFFYGFYFVGAMIDASSFNPSVNRRAVAPVRVAQLYAPRFQTEALAKAIGVTVASKELEAWSVVRNLLAHRASPGRAFVAGSNVAEWLGQQLSGDLVRDRRAWLAKTMQELFSPAVAFVHQHVV
jgi:hypothetical protein